MLDTSHIAYAKTHYGRVRFDLADSAVPPAPLDALGLPSAAKIPKDGPGLLRRLEKALGKRVGAPGDRVVLVAGASEANAAVFAALVGPGDEVLVESPGYEPHRLAPGLFKAPLRFFARRRENAYRVEPSEIAASLTDRTRLVVITDLHNPSGQALSPEEAAAIGGLAERRGFHVLVDEAYRDADASRAIGAATAYGPRFVSTSSLTKSYGLGGLRIGWVAAGKEVLARVERAHNSLSSQVSILSAALAMELVPHLDRLRAAGHEALAKNHAAFAAFTAERPELAPVAPPRGTTAFSFLGPDGRGDRFAETCLDRYDVLLTPGRFFGEPGGLRFSIGGEPGEVAEALKVVGTAWRTFSAS
ncbi:MAG: pyridoxal phosphate-dependent aminotransferase [Acidobacteriota bacterium]